MIYLFIQHLNSCETNTSVYLSEGKQGFICTGGNRNVCGQKQLPPKNIRSSPAFITHVKLNPKGPDSWACEAGSLQNAFTFTGSYYHAFVKIAKCPTPKGKYGDFYDYHIKYITLIPRRRMIVKTMYCPYCS